MEHIAPIIVAVTALLGLFGAAFKFIYTKIENRFVSIENDLKMCYQREMTTKERRGIMVMVIELLITELKSVAPESFALQRSERLMEEVKRIDDDEEANWQVTR